MKHFLYVAAIALVLCACKAPVVELGLGGWAAAGGGTPLGAPPCTAPPPADAGDTESLAVAPDAGLAGTWQGYIEQSTESLTVTFADPGDGTLHGTVVFGTGSPPPLPTSPTEAYPPAGTGLYDDGFPFTAVEMSLTGARLQFAIALNQVFTPWCLLQTSYDWGGPAPGMCGCLPNWAGQGSTDPSQPSYLDDPTTGQLVPVNGNQVAMCQVRQDCDCYTSGCTVTLSRHVSETFDMQLTPGHLDGSMVNNNVHLTLSP